MKTTFSAAPTIPQLAKAHGVPRRTMFYRLMKLQALDVSAGNPRWLFRWSDVSPWRVNVELLSQSHPELFGVDRANDLDARIEKVEQHVIELRTKARSLGSRLRQVANGVE